MKKKDTVVECWLPEVGRLIVRVRSAGDGTRMYLEFYEPHGGDDQFSRIGTARMARSQVLQAEATFETVTNNNRPRCYELPNGIKVTRDYATDQQLWDFTHAFVPDKSALYDWLTKVDLILVPLRFSEALRLRQLAMREPNSANKLGTFPLDVTKGR